MKKINAGLLAGIIMIGIGVLIAKVFQYFFPSLMVEYENTNLLKPLTDPIMLIYFLGPLFLGIILAWIWDLARLMLKGKNSTEKGLYFGYLFWVITIPGLLMAFSSYPLSVTIVISWSVILLFQALCSGFVFSKILK